MNVLYVTCCREDILKHSFATVVQFYCVFLHQADEYHNDMIKNLYGLPL